MPPQQSPPLFGPGSALGRLTAMFWTTTVGRVCAWMYSTRIGWLFTRLVLAQVKIYIACMLMLPYLFMLLIMSTRDPDLVVQGAQAVAGSVRGKVEAVLEWCIRDVLIAVGIYVLVAIVYVNYHVFNLANEQGVEPEL